MTDLSSVDLDHLSNLSRLNLSDEEKSRFTSELPAIIDFVDQLQRVTLDQQAETKPVVSLGTLREDQPRDEGLSLRQIEALSPQFRDGQVVVPAVFSEVENA